MSGFTDACKVLERRRRKAWHRRRTAPEVVQVDRMEIDPPAEEIVQEADDAQEDWKESIDLSCLRTIDDADMDDDEEREFTKELTFGYLSSLTRDLDWIKQAVYAHLFMNFANLSGSSELESSRCFLLSAELRSRQDAANLFIERPRTIRSLPNLGTL